MVMSDKEKRLTAYHEAGHAIVGLNVPSHDPIYKATIIPRGRALGMVSSLPEEDQLSQTREQLTSMIAMALGGRVAEEIIFGDAQVTTGAASDIQQVTRIAKGMVTQAGMSEKLGMINYSNTQETYLGMRSSAADVSPDTQKVIDEEVRSLVDAGYETARRILTEKLEDLHALANGLLEYETLTGDEIQRVIRGETLDRSDDDDGAVASPISSIGVPKTRPGPEHDGGMEPQPQG